MSNNLVEVVFQNELTAAGLAELRAKYPADVVTDMSVEDNFKQARKTRTEMNKLVDAINRRRIDVSTEIKTHGDNLIKQVEDIYSVIVEPFEIEDNRRKQIAAEEKRKRDELLARQRADLNNISGAVADCIGKSSAYIQDTIEAIDLIDEVCFDKELIHEVIDAKQNTLNSLAAALSQTIANEAAAEATKAAEAQMAEMRAQMEAMQQQLKAQHAINQPEPEQPVAEQVKTAPASLQEAKQVLANKLDGVFTVSENNLKSAIINFCSAWNLPPDAESELIDTLNSFGIEV